jgi:5-methylcytosine-specific restriction endonuclease McrBC GTP-binding regulatory subunit McrB
MDEEKKLSHSSASPVPAPAVAVTDGTEGDDIEFFLAWWVKDPDFPEYGKRWKYKNKLEEIAKEYKKAFNVNYNVFEIASDDDLEQRKKDIQGNCKKRDTEWKKYNQSLSPQENNGDNNVPNAIVNKHFIKYLDTIIKMKKILKLLTANKNLILTGAPGTGKTYLAKEIASQMIYGEVKDEKSLTGEEKKIWDERVAFVQFHPSYDYTDFVEGLRPTPPDENGNIGFERKDGAFKEFCKEALVAFDEDKNKTADEKRKCVFIIDEINRGEISKIFGELFFSIDPSYRGEKGKVQTQYANLIDDGDVFKEGFFVPDNVYIIGTMNDIDRSVESFDFAMRRRFTWKEITAQESAENMKLSDATKEKMKSLNAAISAIEGLNSAYHIGGAYFLDKDGKERTDYDEIWELRLKPLLFEYLRGMSDAENKLNKLKQAYDNAG